MEMSQLLPRRPMRASTIASNAARVDTPFSTGKVDIIAYSLTGVDDSSLQIHITSLPQLATFLRSPLIPQSEYLLLIEDISREVVDDLKDYLRVPSGVFDHHTQGSLNSDNNQQAKNALHSELLVSTLLGRASTREDNHSITWWKLSTHSLSKYSYEIEALTESDADATRIVVPHFNVHISNTRRKVGPTKRQVVQVKSGVNELLRQWKRTKDEAEQVTRKEQIEETVCTLYSNTYRAHQVISEVKDSKWGSASEERLTYIKATRHGSTFHLFLFDKARMLQENNQVFETDYSNARSFGVLDGLLKNSSRRPVTKLVREEKGALISTFLTMHDAKILPLQPITKLPGNRVVPTDTNSGAPTGPYPNQTFGQSTRDRFLSHVLEQGFSGDIVDLPRPEGTSRLPVLRIKIAFTKMVAHDWDLVLSQMGQTLDDIDIKMSDNTELRNNVLAWRRLLGSWRMTIIEYRAKLLETDQFLRYQLRHLDPAFNAVSSTESAHRRQSPESAHILPLPEKLVSEVEDVISSYEILAAAIQQIEIRVERTFQALMSSMSILESQKAITQGSGVARLTELAFIFIPLNFACTFFSMQIKEFQGSSQPSISAFFALAIPLMLFLYSIRAFIRSSLLEKMKITLDSRIRETSKIPGTSEIPTRVILSFGWQQLGPFSRALLIVVPLATVILVLINTFGQWTPFRITGSIVTVLGTLIIIALLAIEKYVPALQVGAIIGWLVSMLGIGLGRIHPLNSAVMGTLCTVVTTVFFIALAFIPQKVTDDPGQRVMEILLPLWLVELPISIICHYYDIHHPRWETWVFLLAIFTVLIVFGLIVAIHGELEVYLGLPQLAAIAAFSIGFPMAMVWSYAPLHGNRLPLYGAIIVTFGSVAVFFFLLDFLSFDNFGTSTLAHSIFFIVLCALVAIPITLVWDTLPVHGILIPRWVQISVTCGSIVTFSMFIVFIPPYSRHMKWLAVVLLWGSTTAWLPALLWAGKIHAFEGLTQNRTNTIHVTWTSVLFWTVSWVVVTLIWDSLTDMF